MSQMLVALAVLMAAGLLVSRGARALKLPNVTAFLVAGLIVGPSVTGLLSREQASSLSIISTAALGFIAFSIGGEFDLKYLKQIGKAPLTITAFQGLTTTLFVEAGMIALGFLIPGMFRDQKEIVPQSLVMGAIALATAPAATLMVVRQYKADGPVTRMLLPVVAMDDALGLMVFSVNTSVASAMMGGEMTVYSVLLKPLIGIVGSLLLGTVLGLLVTWAERFFRSRGNSLSVAIAAVFAGAGLCELLAEYSFSSLLVCMMIGATVSNLSAKKKTVMEQTDRFTPPLFLLFFVLSGANLDLSVLPSVGIIGAAYIALRSFGKWFGTMTGAAAVKADGNIRKYLGLTLLPQAGVAIGMAQLVMPMFPDFGLKVNAVVLAATLVYELIGPVITKIALTKAGEIAAEK